jgi:hypothetical protein
MCINEGGHYQSARRVDFTNRAAGRRKFTGDASKAPVLSRDIYQSIATVKLRVTNDEIILHEESSLKAC